jgi:hypothetical protein
MHSLLIISNEFVTNRGVLYPPSLTHGFYFPLTVSIFEFIKQNRNE